MKWSERVLPEHELFRYNRSRGLRLLPCAKCRCGADLHGSAAIAMHERVVEHAAA